MLADSVRIQLLWVLVGHQMSVNDLATEVGKPAPSVPQHMPELRMSRLICTRREGTTVCYSLDNDHVRQLVTVRCVTPSTPGRESRPITAPMPR